MIDRYGGELEYDLHHELGLDLLDWFRGRHPWPKLLRLAARLPAHSQYKAAAADDDDLAEQLADRAEGESAQAWMTMLGWTPERALLTALVEAVGDLTAITIAVNSEGGKVPDAPRLPRPALALDRIEKRRAEQAREALLDKLLPGRTSHPLETEGGG